MSAIDTSADAVERLASILHAGGFAVGYSALEQAAATLRALSADIARKDAALRDAVAYMNGYGMSDAEQPILDAARAALAPEPGT